MVALRMWPLPFLFLCKTGQLRVNSGWSGTCVKYIVCPIIGTIGFSSLFVRPVLAGEDLRFDVSTSNNALLLPHLSFPSANGHVNLIGGSTYKSQVESYGNTAGIYYNTFNQVTISGASHSTFTYYPNPHDMAEAVQTWVNGQWTSGRDGWLAMNEISSSTWQSNPTNSAGYDYHTWCADVVSLLKNGDNSDPSHVVPAHTGVILWAPFSKPAGNASSWQAIAKNAIIGDECWIDGPDGRTNRSVFRRHRSGFLPAVV